MPAKAIFSIPAPVHLPLSHFCPHPTLILEPRKQGAQNITFKPAFKPEGLWVSVDGPDDWPSWCLAQSFNIKNLSHRYRVFLQPQSKIIWLRTLQEINLFYLEFRVTSQRHYNTINWPLVAQEADGIIIAPHYWDWWKSEMDHTWYGGWDCASGCIWNTEAIRVAYAERFRKEQEER